MLCQDKIDAFINLLWEWNRGQNLVSRRIDRGELTLHIKDSLAVLPYLLPTDSAFIDVGSGQGFPGLLLAMARPESRFCLLEADQKKCGFLEVALLQMDLHNACIVSDRAEQAGRKSDKRECFDVGVSRGVAELGLLAEWVLPFIRIGGRMIAWKGPGAAAETAKAAAGIEVLGGELENIEKYRIGDKERALVFIRKVSATPDRFPRVGGSRKKQPR